jgi:CspA family cold shock protein
VSGRRRLLGRVVAFDEDVGLGEIEAATGADEEERFQFHCTQIADGSRAIPVGAEVSFGVLAGRGGRWEAADIQPAGPVRS